MHTDAFLPNNTAHEPEVRLRDVGKRGWDIWLGGGYGLVGLVLAVLAGDWSYAGLFGVIVGMGLIALRERRDLIKEERWWKAWTAVARNQNFWIGDKLRERAAKEPPSVN